MRFFLTIQILIYLVIPLFVFDLSYYSVLYLSTLLFLSFFLVGSHINFINVGDRVKDISQQEVKIRPIITFSVVAIVMIVYYYFAAKNGILERRIGTLQIANAFAAIPLKELLFIRLTEMATPTVLFVMWLAIYSNEKSSKIAQLSLFFVVTVLFLYVSGKWQSKSELVYFFVILFILTGKLSSYDNILRNGKSVLGLFVVSLGVFGAITFYRYTTFGSDLSTMISQDFIQRVNGHKITSQLIDKDLLTIAGTADLSAYKYYIAMFPFFEQATVYKELATTSAKNYLLYDLLELKQFDEITTYVSDLLYVGGLAAVAMGGTIIGVFAKLTDQLILSGEIQRNTILTAFALSSIMALSRLEFELIPQLFMFTKLFVMNLILVFTFKKVAFSS
ncbi:hypothetical protein [Enterovibrio norvegicus]|uniref:hypothetical protein n=1 Tax=Enterovibrio norvegicus TaxID=188144 RepID=UPI000C8638BA|nr:hypothetical protein [Enterovibrio norvegicus]PMH72477.1 hypothetical protein BCU62_02360 [Enterovibrio norvegicus]